MLTVRKGPQFWGPYYVTTWRRKLSVVPSVTRKLFEAVSLLFYWFYPKCLEFWLVRRSRCQLKALVEVKLLWRPEKVQEFSLGYWILALKLLHRGEFEVCFSNFGNFVVFKKIILKKEKDEGVMWWSVNCVRGVVFVCTDEVCLRVFVFIRYRFRSSSQTLVWKST